MNIECDELHAFIDGNLDDEQQERFKQHLSGCARCQSELHDVLQIALRMQEPGRLSSRHNDSKAHGAGLPGIQGMGMRGALARRPLQRAALALAIGAAALYAVFVLVRPRAKAPVLVDENAESRPLLARVSLAEADRWQPFNPLRGSTESSGSIRRREALPELERKGDWARVATIYLLNGESRPAAAALSRAERSPDNDNNRAVLAMSARQWEEALNLLDGVLQAKPHHPQALWNRGLVLRELRLSFLAADSFRRVAELKESGWSDEATKLANEMRNEAASRQASWNAAKKAGIELMRSGAAPAEALVRAHPGILRLFFDHALAAAPSRDRARGLLPTALALDERFGQGTSLARAVRVVSEADFSVREPLARTYRNLYDRNLSLDDSGGVAYLERLRKSGQPDILFSALLLQDVRLERMNDLRRVVGASTDPWSRAIVEAETAKTLVAEGALLDAEKRLLNAIPTCHASGIEYRCAYLDHGLSNLYLNLNLPVEARKYALAGFEHARTGGEWRFELLFIQDLAAAARFHRAYGLSRAYLDELGLREPGDCKLEQFANLQRAQLHIEELRPAEARAELARVHGCEGKPEELATADLYADLAYVGLTDEEKTRALALLATYRTGGHLTPTEIALTDKTEARLLIGRDRSAALALLESAIRKAEARPPFDVDAKKARNYSYATLVEDAGRGSRWDEMLALIAREMRLPPPARCAVGVALDRDRLLVSVRGSDGLVRGTVEKQRAGTNVPVVVGPALLSAIESCAVVDVYARPPLQGTPEILPARFAWRYRVSPSVVEPTPSVTPRRVVIAGVEAPVGLDLPPLAAWTSSTNEKETTLLTGPSATPERVLREINSATEIEFHAHGLVDLAVSDVSHIVLTPGASGLYALTARQVRESRLTGSPVVILAACRAAETAPYRHEPWSLPIAFIDAGASAVLAAASSIRDLEAGPFFVEVRTRTKQGAPLAVALRDVRVAALARNEHTSMRDVMLFQ